MRQMRNIVKIDEDKCNGCGQCVTACAEGAIEIVDGKARLVSEVYCDGLGACLGECPTDAITIEQRPAEAFDEAATEAHLAGKAEEEKAPMAPKPFVCPGAAARKLAPVAQADTGSGTMPAAQSQLGNWPVQLKLVPPQAPYLQNADLLLVADCVPFALPDFHSRFLKGKPVLIACPKLDEGLDDYVAKLADIFRNGQINSLAIIHMEVPCCSGLVRIAQAALAESGATIPTQDVVIGIQGDVLSEAALS